MAKTQKKSLLTLIRGRGVTLAAVMMLSISAGTFVLPKIFADTSTKFVGGVYMTPTNNITFDINFKWTGKTTDHYNVVAYHGSTQILNYNTTNPAMAGTINHAVCGSTYTVKVSAVGPDGYKSDYKSDTASTRCPGVAWSNFSASGNNIVSSWRSTSGFAQTYNYYLKTGSGGYVTSSTTATSRTISGSCATTYTAYLIPYANGEYGPASPVVSAATAACPKSTPAPAPSPKPAPTPAPSGGNGGSSTTTKSSSSSSGSSASGSKAAKSRSASSGAAAAVPTAPDTPENFSAEVTSQKLVGLQWDAATNADHYVLRRSTDNLNWQDIATTKDTNYTDESTSFDSTYYYQLVAVGGDGQVSDSVIAQASTESFSATGDTITSPDKRVQVQLPATAIDGTHSCSISSSTKGLSVPPAGQKLVLGPYDLVCVTDDGQVVDTFAQPVKVTMKLGDTAKGYKNIGVRTITDGTAWQTQKATYNEKTQQLSFTLTSAKTLAAFGVKSKSIVGVILIFLLILLLLGAALFGYLFWWRRRQTPEHIAEVQKQVSAEQEFRQALAKPDCTHLGEAQQVIPSGSTCTECEQQGTHWNALRICLICGHVGCSDDSEQQHAYKHFQQTGHPIIYDYADPRGNSIGWCYIDQTYI